MSSISPIHPKRESALPSQPRKMGGSRLYSFPEGNSHKTTLSSQRVFHERRNNRAHSLSASSASSRKQKHPQPVQEKQAAIEDDDDHMSNFSDSDEDDNSHFIYKSQARHIETGITRKCDWCDRLSTQCELTLVTHDRVNKNFCTEDCQDLFKDNLLSRKVCEWCKKSCPTELTMIVVEPSTESVPLQFCAQSCVNKYKMEVFCEEVKEQLRRIKEGNIQIPNVSKPNHKERKILITPELWSEGESAMVFVNDSPAHSSNCEPQNRLADPLTSQGVDISERKRKGSSMETVISKLSRRQHRYTIKPATDSMTHYCADIPDRQTTPINLSVHKAPSTALPVRVDNSNTEPTPGAHQSQTTPAAKISSEQCKPWNGSLFMPLPILIPIPIPIPIPMNKYAEALAAAAIKKDSSTAAPVSQRKDSVTNEQISVPVNPLGPKRYVLKRPLTSDDPE